MFTWRDCDWLCVCRLEDSRAAGWCPVHWADAKHLPYVVELSEDLPRRVIGDPARLRQILVNLIGNAIKFTDAGVVRLVVACASESAEAVRLRFRVIDTGIGIAEAAQRRLFKPFEQLDNTLALHHVGTGLGTAIAKGLTEAMGGRIGVNSAVGGGSEFWVVLPLRILIADDHATNHLVLHRQFEDRRAAVTAWLQA